MASIFQNFVFLKKVNIKTVNICYENANNEMVAGQILLLLMNPTDVLQMDP